MIFLLRFFILLSIYFSRPLTSFWGLCDRISVFHSLFLCLWKYGCPQRSDTALHEVRGKLKLWILWGPLGRDIKQSTAALWAHWALCLDSTALPAAFTWSRNYFVKAWLRPEVLPFLTRSVCYPALTILHLEHFCYLEKRLHGVINAPWELLCSQHHLFTNTLLCSSAQQSPASFHPALHPGTCL